MDFGRDIVAFDCGSDAVLYSAASGDLYVLNDTAAVIYRALACGVAMDDVCSGVATATRADAREVERDVRRVVDTLHELAARGRKAATAAAPQAAPKGLEPQGRAVAEASASRIDTEPTGALPYRQRYRLADFRFELRSAESDDHRAAESVLGHLHDCSPCEVDAVLRLVRRGDDAASSARGGNQRWLLLDDSAAIVDECAAASAVAPMLHANTLMLAYERTPRFAALHAGVVLKNGQCIVLPAPSGSGKSTLTAALVMAGYGYCTDDFAILSGPPIGVLPVPLGIGLKEGSWDALADRMPALAALPTHVRADGKRVRYLPMRLAHSGGGALPVRALVFPQYRAGEAARCRPMRPADALVRLAASGYDARLSTETVRSLIDWLCDVPSYELAYGDLNRAIAAIDAIAS
jgi:hypothetical protein